MIFRVDSFESRIEPMPAMEAAALGQEHGLARAVMTLVQWKPPEPFTVQHTGAQTWFAGQDLKFAQDVMQDHFQYGTAGWPVAVKLERMKPEQQDGAPTPGLDDSELTIVMNTCGERWLQHEHSREARRNMVAILGPLVLLKSDDGAELATSAANRHWGKVLETPSADITGTDMPGLAHRAITVVVSVPHHSRPHVIRVDVNRLTGYIATKKPSEAPYRWTVLQRELEQWRLQQSVPVPDAQGQ